jgi:hypothetical protein
MITYLKSRILYVKKLTVFVTKHLFRIIDSLIDHHSRQSCGKCRRATNIENRKSIGGVRAGHSVA